MMDTPLPAPTKLAQNFAIATGALIPEKLKRLLDIELLAAHLEQHLLDCTIRLCSTIAVTAPLELRFKCIDHAERQPAEKFRPVLVLRGHDHRRFSGGWALKTGLTS